MHNCLEGTMNLYTCKYYFPSILTILVSLIPIGLGIYLLSNIKNPFTREPIRILIIGVASTILGAVFLTSYMYTYIDNYRSVFLKAQSGQVEVIEGEVTNFKPVAFFEGGSDRFEVDGVEFFVGRIMGPGYNKTASNGGVINKEGMLVRIEYVLHDQETHIVGIQLIEDADGDVRGRRDNSPVS